jgi:tungstate transport system ATP-binding protein
MSDAAAIYRLEWIRHRYGAREVLAVDRLDIARGETFAFVGPSGGGKSTLLRLLQFLERPTSGTVCFDGSVSASGPPLDVRRRVTTVFQRPIVLDRSVRANIEYGVKVRGTTPDRAAIDRLLESVGLAHVAGASARTLSGGETQRVALGRALAFAPEVLLLDEPTANLDPGNVRLVEDLVRQQQAAGVTVVLATHQIFQARRLAHRAAFLLDGRIVESGPTPGLFEHPSDPRTRAFLSGEMVY